MKKKLHFPLSSPKIRQQIIHLYLLVAIAPIVIIGCFSTLYLRKQMTDKYVNQIKADALRVKSILFDITTSMYTSCESITTDLDCMSLFGTNYSTDSDAETYNRVASLLDTLRQNNAAISSIQIYTNNPSIPVGPYIIPVGNDYTNEVWYNQLKPAQWNTWIYLKQKDKRTKKDIYQLSLVQRIGVISKEYSAYMVLCLDNNYLKNRIEQSNYEIMASVDDSPIFYASKQAWIRESMPFPTSYNEEYVSYTGPLELDNSTVLSEFTTFLPYKTSNKFYICVNDKLAYPTIDRMSIMFGIIVSVSILIPTALIFLFSNYFSKRVNTLKHAMHQASLGDYNIIEQFQGDDELSETFTDLKKTVDLIHEKDALFYQSRLNEQQLVNQQQQMEFKMLASQINPHFLYNTLETIRMQAIAAGNKDVATSIRLLGKSMHYVLENTGSNSTTLAHELEYVKTYLSIQHLRFGNRVKYCFDIPDTIDLTQYRIQPLLLQPIVENSITHGLESVESDGLITISVELSEHHIMIHIQDNGAGMSAEQLEYLKNSIMSSDHKSTNNIGLYNTNQRLRLLYGEQYNLIITSTLNVGTTVTLKLPITSDEK